MSDTALDRIRANQKSKNTTLDLSNLALTEIPKAVRKLEWLERLDLSQNQIEKIEGLENLSNLQVLDLSQNQIEKIEGLENLSNLQVLYLDQNQIEKIEGLDNLSNLQWLYLSQNQIEKIEGLDNLSNLQWLYLSQNQIEKIEGLENLSNLQVLSLSQNQIEKIEGLENLSNLQWLYLDQNQIEKIEGLDNLSNLQGLYLSQNQIEKIEGLENLSNLQVLSLSQNQIEKIEGLDNLSNLQVLDLSQNQIEKIEGLENLSNLQWLYLDQNQIEKIEGLDNLSNLQVLSLSQNQIEKIEGLDNLSNLQVLSLSQNQIEKIEGLDKLLKLALLDLSKNPLYDTRPLHAFICRRDLSPKWEDSSFEWVTTAPEDPNNVSLSFDFSLIGKRYAKAQKGIYLKDCHQLKIPSPEWIQLGHAAVKNYLEAIEAEGPIELNEAKVMIVGRPHAGKTTLSEKIRNADAPMPEEKDSTQGIQVEDWEYKQADKTYTAHLWDFGGQDVQYAIHQFFMTQRAVYLLVDCTRDPEQNMGMLGETKSEVISNYWLQTIEKMANGSPTFYLNNVYEPYAVKELTFQNLSRQYGFLYKYPLNLNLSKVSKQHEGDIQVVRAQLQTAISELPNVGLVLPSKWMAVKVKLSEAAATRSHLSLEEYLQLCRDCDIQEEGAAILISRYLHEIGSIIHYSDKPSSALYHLVILRRKWATEASYQVIFDELVLANNGRVTVTDLQRIWSNRDYSKMMPALLELLKRFEICYPLPNASKETYLVPQCLSDQLPEGVDAHLGSVLSLRYHYGFLPYGIVNRLAVRLHRLIHDNKVWKKGMVLRKGAGQVVVEERKTYNQGYILLTMSGDQRDRWYLQQRVMEQLEELNMIYNLGEVVDKMVPCVCAPCQKRTQPYLHPYKKLLKKLKLRKMEEECGESPFEAVKILDLIDHAFVERPEAVEQSLNKGRGLFEGAHIGKVVLGDDKSKQVQTGEQSIVQIAESGSQNETQPTAERDPLNLFEYFRVRQLVGWWVAAIAAAVACLYFPILEPYAGLVLVVIGGLGTKISLTRDSKFLRMAKWVLWLGLGAAGILNGLPAFFGEGGLIWATDSGIVHFLGKFSMDDKPIYTVLILLLTFGLASLLVWKEQQQD